MTARIRESSSRRFMLLDAMILVAATAVGLASMRAFAEYLERDRRSPAFCRVLDYGSLALPGCVLHCAPSVSVVGRNADPTAAQPRPSVHRLFRQPGLVASISAAIGSVIRITLILLLLLFYNISFYVLFTY